MIMNYMKYYNAPTKLQFNNNRLDDIGFVER